ncbi:MAG: DUF92 domain-containing protein [Saprospiraceae bacterium]|nr:DUF92 domain-containing protein [Saprospiraceae bacterium]
MNFELIILGAAVLVLTLVTEGVARKGWLPQWVCRKILHVGAVGACSIAPMILQDLNTLRMVVACAEPVLFYLVASGRLFSEEDGRKSWGIALFPLAYLVLLFVFPNDRWLIGLPMAILAVSDAVAAVAGHLWGRSFFSLTGDRKSWTGSTAFAMSVPIVTITFFFVFPKHFPETIYLDTPFFFVLAGIAIMLAAFEALGSRGFDNLYVPLAAAALFWRLPNMLEPGFHALLFNACIPFSFAFAAAGLRKGWLSAGGAVTASLLGLWVTYFAGVQWLLPLFFFFISSTVLGRLAPKSTAADAKHGKARDALQVVCNGGIFAFLALFAGEENVQILTLMAVSMAVCTADTWASEIGLVFRQKTYDIVRFKTVPPGLSGGISVAGTIGGLAGALAMALFCNLLLFDGLNVHFIFKITFLGTFGMLLDSVLGATWQARFRKNDLETDMELPGSTLANGHRWFDNDAVNVVSNAVVVGLSVGWLVF